MNFKNGFLDVKKIVWSLLIRFSLYGTVGEKECTSYSFSEEVHVRWGTTLKEVLPRGEKGWHYFKFSSRNGSVVSLSGFRF